MALSWFMPTHAAGANQETPSSIHWGECNLEAPVAPETAWPQVCLKSRAAMAASLRSRDSARNLQQNYAEGYAGLHLRPEISVHFEGQWRDNNPFGLRESKARGNFSTRHSFVQLGNATTSPVRASIGRITLPFGINSRNLPEIYYDQYLSSKFWHAPPFGIRLGVDNGSDLSVDMGVSYETPTSPLSSQLRGQESASSLRIMYDSADLGGTRFVLSLMDHSTSERKYGAGVINRSPEGAVTSIEWVRTRMRNEGRSGDYSQLTRLSIRGPESRTGLFFLELDDFYPVHWLTTFGYDFLSSRWSKVRVSASYLRSRSPAERSHWVTTLGVEGHL